MEILKTLLIKKRSIEMKSKSKLWLGWIKLRNSFYEINRKHNMRRLVFILFEKFFSCFLRYLDCTSVWILCGKNYKLSNF